MNQFIAIIGYCLFCIVVSAVAMKYLKTWWVYFIISVTLPPMMLVGADALWRGYLDAWADIAFIVAWLIAFGCALGYYLVRRLIDRSGHPRGRPDDSSVS